MYAPAARRPVAHKYFRLSASQTCEKQQLKGQIGDQLKVLDQVHLKLQLRFLPDPVADDGDKQKMNSKMHLDTRSVKYSGN